MKKDVIYIDIDDDITAVIEKVKNSSEKIVALVPPKGSAVLQSVVNLKLVKRAATTAKKQTVLISNNQALQALAGGLGLYVAKNLQSKPFIPGADQADLPEDTVEVSDGVGDLEDDSGKTVDLHEGADTDESEVELSENELASLDEPTNDDSKPAAGPKKAKNKKIPNFNDFRKKLLIGGGIFLLALIIIVVLFGKTKAAVVIRAETTPADVALEASFNANSSQSDVANRALKAQIQETKKTVSQSFAATGQKDLGTKASGTMSFSIRCADVDDDPPTIPAGTGVSANNLTFITQTATSLTYTPSPCRFTGSTRVVAQNNGDQYNLSSRGYSVSGFSDVSANGNQMSGGTSRVVKVVSQADVDKAREQLNQQDTNDIRKELKEGFADETTILEDTFTTTFGNVVSEPAVDQEANEARLTAEVTYSILGVSNEDIGAVLDKAITDQMTNKEQQRVYKNGLAEAKFEKLSGDARTATYRISTLGYYGPQFNEDELKNQITAKKIGEVRSYLQDLPGVKGVDISLSPFWARSTPDPSRIQITLEVDDQN
jgi:hypothetical protein